MPKCEESKYISIVQSEAFLKGSSIHFLFMKIVTWNVNKPAQRRSLRVVNYLLSQEADILCLQELTVKHGPKVCGQLRNEGYTVFHTLDKQGLPGEQRESRVLVAIRGAGAVEIKINGSMEKNYLHKMVEFGGLTILCSHVPNAGGKCGPRRIVKQSHFQFLSKVLAEHKDGKCILCGDLNSPLMENDSEVIGHDAVKCKGSEEHYFWQQLTATDFRDAVREAYGGISASQMISFAGNRTANARRFDHFLISKGIFLDSKPKYLTEVMGKGKLSDHAPLAMEFSL